MKMYKIYRIGHKKEVARVKAHSNYSARFNYMLEMKFDFGMNSKVTDFKARKI